MFSWARKNFVGTQKRVRISHGKWIVMFELLRFDYSCCFAFQWFMFSSFLLFSGSCIFFSLCHKLWLRTFSLSSSIFFSIVRTREITFMTSWFANCTRLTHSEKQLAHKGWNLLQRGTIFFLFQQTIFQKGGNNYLWQGACMLFMGTLR